MNSLTGLDRLDGHDRMPLGRCYITAGARSLLEETGEAPSKFLRRHEIGDWGDVCSEDKYLNDMARRKGGRILSSYLTANGKKVWIITEADRRTTTILLPREY